MGQTAILIQHWFLPFIIFVQSHTFVRHARKILFFACKLKIQEIDYKFNKNHVFISGEIHKGT